MSRLHSDIRSAVHSAILRYRWLPASAVVASGLAFTAFHIVHARLLWTILAGTSWLFFSYAWGYSDHALKGDLYLPLNHLKRRQYAEVWDALAASRTDASRAAAGETDEEELRRSARRTIDYLVELASISIGDDVLEIGCGVGRIGRGLAAHCNTWTGTDISANMLGCASDHMQGVSNARFVLLRADGLGKLAESSFDVVYATNMLGHLDEVDRWRYVEQTFRLLRPGGRLLLDNIDLESDGGWSMFANDARRSQGLELPPYMPRFSTAAELSAYARRAGFENIQSHHRSPLVILTAAKPL
jgi:ubiquinone/menaquinone biosynthesis C-methylase UbiE